MKSISKIKVIILAFLCFFTSAVLIGCQNNDDLQQTQNSKSGTENNIKSLEQNISEYKDEIESLQAQKESLNEQNQYLVDVIKQMSENLSDEEMLEFSQNQIKYDLQVNGKSIPKNGEMVISSGDVKILLSETNMGYDFLQPEWLEKGKISGNYIDHILDLDTTNWTPVGADGTVNTSRGYETTDIKTGEQITFNITDELKERLNLDTNLIQIEVN